MTNLATLFIAVLTLVTAFVDVSAQQITQSDTSADAAKGATIPPTTSPFDPKSLIGDWVGEWKNPPAVGSTNNRGRDRSVRSGAYLLTITAVDGTTIHGSVQITNPTLSPKDDFVGTLEGNRLTFKAKTRSADLVYDGIMMSGSGLGNTAHVIENLKKK